MKTTYIKYLLLPTMLMSQMAFAQEEENASAKKDVNVAFRKVAAQELMGGVSVLDYEELAEKNTNTYSLDNMQGYVSGFNGSSLWGQTGYLVLVDGVPRDQNNVKPEEIAQVTFMKGANAVVLYGSRAAKGAILITTKRGNDENLQIKVSANTGWNVAKSYPEYLGSAEYMTLYNEALVNDGIAPRYSESQIYNTYAGVNPYRYPNINMYSSDYIKKSYNRTDLYVEFRGGAKRTHYYANVGYYRQGDQLNFGEAKNNYTDRLNVRGNVDMQLLDWISAYANANVNFYSSRTAAGANYWENAATLRPNRLVPMIPSSFIDPNNPTISSLISVANLYNGGMFLGMPEDAIESEHTNVIADTYAAGKNKYNSRQFEFTLGINLDLARVTKGLSFSTMFAVDYATSYNTSYNDTYATYQPTWGSYNGQDMIVGLVKHNVDKHSGVQNVSDSQFKQTINFNAHFDYERTFAEKHNVYAMLLANGWQQSQSGEYHRVSNVNAGLLANYNYDHRYFFEFGSALIHSAKLASGHRKGFNYSFTAGWQITNEKFIDKESSIFDDLTLSASYSHLNQDLDIEKYYMYAGSFDYANGAWWGWGVGDAQHSTNAKNGANPELDFVKQNQASVNLRGSLLDKSLSFDVSYFYTTNKGLITKVENLYPSYFSTYYPESSMVPYSNYNNEKRYGVDLALNYKKQFNKDWSFGAGINMTYYKTEVTRRDDSGYADAYQYRTGKAIDAIWGYKSLGLFKDQAEIDAAPEQKLGEAPKPGDIRYADINDDGVVDSKDQIDLGCGGWYGNPLTLGVNLTAKWKGLTLFVLATGGFGGKASKGDEGSKRNLYYWIHGDSKYSAVVRGRAIVKNGVVTNPDTATYPRLTTGSGANNFVTSDYWLYRTDQFNIAKIQLSYEMPNSWFEGKVVKGVSVFANGSNLLTIAKEREILEMNIGSAPQNRFYQVGASVKF